MRAHCGQPLLFPAPRLWKCCFQGSMGIIRLHYGQVRMGDYEMGYYDTPKLPARLRLPFRGLSNNGLKREAGRLLPGLKICCCRGVLYHYPTWVAEKIWKKNLWSIDICHERCYAQEAFNITPYRGMLFLTNRAELRIRQCPVLKVLAIKHRPEMKRSNGWQVSCCLCAFAWWLNIIDSILCKIPDMLLIFMLVFLLCFIRFAVRWHLIGLLLAFSGLKSQ